MRKWDTATRPCSTSPAPSSTRTWAAPSSAPRRSANAFAKATRPTTLEYDLAKGGRGERERIVRHRLKLSTGAEAATVVNNNAAAVLLVLNTLALGREVAVSRGELIEIGGSFRLPEIMQRAGCKLAEVGTTNRTHPRDFEAAAATAALLLKVHPSNYHVEGFTREVTASPACSHWQATWRSRPVWTWAAAP